MNAIIVILMISLASAAISFTITTTTIFLWLRELVSPIHHKLEELIHCPWCLGHYVAATLLIIFNSKTLFIDINPFWHYILNWFTAVCIMGLCHYILLQAYIPIGKAMVDRQIQKLRNQQNEQS